MDVFPQYKNHYEAIKLLPAEYRGEVLLAINAYAFDDEIIEMSPVALAMFTIIKPSIDKSKARAEAGSKGGKATANAEQSESKDEANDKQTSSKTEANTEQSGTILNIKYETQETSNKTITRARESDFNELWELYPRKQGRREAFEAFKRAIHDGDTVEEIRAGIRRYSEHLLRTKTEPRFIKQGSTYFRQRAWKDQYNDSTEGEYLQRDDDMADVFMEL